jgi:signal transduction histidine kinase
MLTSLADAFERQRRFLADASHELRTPLTVVRGQLELLADELDGPAGSALHMAQQELDRMARIIDDLLLLARLDEGCNFGPSLSSWSSCSARPPCAPRCSRHVRPVSRRSPGSTHTAMPSASFRCSPTS